MAACPRAARADVGARAGTRPHVDGPAGPGACGRERAPRCAVRGRGSRVACPGVHRARRGRRSPAPRPHRLEDALGVGGALSTPGQGRSAATACMGRMAPRNEHMNRARLARRCTRSAAWEQTEKTRPSYREACLGDTRASLAAFGGLKLPAERFVSLSWGGVRVSLRLPPLERASCAR